MAGHKINSQPLEFVPQVGESGSVNLQGSAYMHCIVEPGDREGLASALRAVLDDAERRARLGRAARQTVETRFSLAATADRYINLYEELSSCAASPGQ